MSEDSGLNGGRVLQVVLEYGLDIVHRLCVVTTSSRYGPGENVSWLVGFCIVGDHRRRLLACILLGMDQIVAVFAEGLAFFLCHWRGGHCR